VLEVALVASDTISGALCGVMEQALIEKGIEPALARALAEKACEPTLQAAPRAAKAAVRKTKRGAKAANRKLSAAFKEANRRLRKKNGELRSGKTQSDVAKLAHKLKKKM
jgi:hypothetical protein